jgi:hypothetical protein
MAQREQTRADLGELTRARVSHGELGHSLENWESI